MPSNYLGAWLATQGDDFNSVIESLRTMCGAVGSDASKAILKGRTENDKISNLSFVGKTWGSADCYCDEDKIAGKEEVYSVFRRYSKEMLMYRTEYGVYYEIADETIKNRW